MQIWKKLADSYTSYWKHKRKYGKRKAAKKVRQFSKKEIDNQRK